MKIGFLGYELKEGKVKYNDEKFNDLVTKYQPQKESPFFVEFCQEPFVSVDALLVHKNVVLDLLIQDMEKLENRLQKTGDEGEKSLLKKCLSSLEKEIPLSDVPFPETELVILRGLAPLSMKPTLVENNEDNVNQLIEKILKKAEIIFFYTAGKKEVHSWPVRKGTGIVECAGVIHSDLARGFIRAEVINYAELVTVYNMQEAKTKGLVKLVGKDYNIQDGDIIEIKFNV